MSAAEHAARSIATVVTHTAVNPLHVTLDKLNNYQSKALLNVRQANSSSKSVLLTMQMPWYTYISHTLPMADMKAAILAVLTRCTMSAGTKY